MAIRRADGSSKALAYRESFPQPRFTVPQIGRTAISAGDAAPLIGWRIIRILRPLSADRSHGVDSNHFFINDSSCRPGSLVGLLWQGMRSER